MPAIHFPVYYFPFSFFLFSLSQKVAPIELVEELNEKTNRNWKRALGGDTIRASKISETKNKYKFKY